MIKGVGSVASPFFVGQLYGVSALYDELFVENNR